MGELKLPPLPAMIRGQNAYLESDVLADRAAVLRELLAMVETRPVGASMFATSAEARGYANALKWVAAELRAVAEKIV